tara:strand:- start:210 stop:422 length:213 start_codon:yes stop_codon:yes gene_type:complete
VIANIGIANIGIVTPAYQREFQCCRRSLARDAVLVYYHSALAKMLQLLLESWIGRGLSVIKKAVSSQNHR